MSQATSSEAPQATPADTSPAAPSPSAHAQASGNLRGIIAMVAAVGFFSLMDALLKTLSASYPAMQVAALRGWAALPLVVLYVVWRREVGGLLKVRWPLHLLRGVINVSMLGLFAYALKELGLAEAYTLFFIAPLLITALSTVVLREKVRAAHWVAIALGMVGVVVALRPSQDAFFTLGALAVLGAACGYAVSAITGRVLTRTDSSASLVFWTTTLLALGAGALALPGWVGVDRAHWPLVAGLAVTGFLGQLAITEAFRHGQASVVAPFEYTALAWGMGLDWVLWQAVPGYSTLLGGAIIIGSGLYLVRQERTQAVVPP
ncbi:DMT family transporter [Acidovorax sp. sic0104]|uniref:DMT family transporter n=1 Tax=Acidovorax sp. sic0104 TaxID=2854784 RepID=UPI001C467E3F|nr:DMT family transporter [Acidovorax sp. sic0104]MBV7542745.1 DMT family transporter [Acidovorax sp. sic0104]